MARRKKESTTAIAERLARPLLLEMGLTLWDLRFEKEGSLWYLRYFIDRDGGVTIDDCERFSRAVEKKLDEADPIDQSYTLEVSSPGIERELTKDWHYQSCMGREVSVLLIRPVEGVREFVGVLMGYSEEGIAVRLPGDIEMTFQPSEAASVRLYNDYSQEEALLDTDLDTDDDEGDQEDG